MRTSATTYRALLGIAAFVLVATGALHATGFSSVSEMVDRSELPIEWAPALKGLWLMFSIHLFVLASLLIVLAAAPAGRAPLAAAALMPAADTVLLYLSVGVFIGTILVGVAAVLVFSALAAHPDRSRSAWPGQPSG